MKLIKVSGRGSQGLLEIPKVVLDTAVNYFRPILLQEIYNKANETLKKLKFAQKKQHRYDPTGKYKPNPSNDRDDRDVFDILNSLMFRPYEVKLEDLEKPEKLINSVLDIMSSLRELGVSKYKRQEFPMYEHFDIDPNLSEIQAYKERARRILVDYHTRLQERDIDKNEFGLPLDLDSSLEWLNEVFDEISLNIYVIDDPSVGFYGKYQLDVLTMNVGPFLDKFGDQVQLGLGANLLDNTLDDALSGTLEHELTHWLQSELMRHHALKVIPNKRTNDWEPRGDDYYSQEIEYAPHLRSSIAELRVALRNARNSDRDYRFTNDEFKSFVGLNYSSNYLSPNSFLMALKRKRPKNYEKAVKILYKYISENGWLE